MASKTERQIEGWKERHRDRQKQGLKEDRQSDI
jgi:hypothetical protein